MNKNNRTCGYGHKSCSLALQGYHDEIYASTGYVYGNVYQYDLETAIASQKNKSNLIPEKSELSQNYPNPFNSMTKINFQIAGNGLPIHTILKIYDTLGREIIPLVDKKKKPGYYSIMWNARDNEGNRILAGVHLCQMKAGDFMQTRKILYLK